MEGSVMKKRLLYKIALIVALVTAGAQCTSASIMSESMIKELAKALEKRGNGQYDCYADHRT